MHDILDLDRYPLHEPDSPACAGLVAQSRAKLDADGLFNLDGFLRQDAMTETVAALAPRFATESFTHERTHNIYFRRDLDLPGDHPALRQNRTVNHTLCADQMPGTPILALYGWAPFVDFLAAVMDKPALFPMADPLAAVNAMEYRAGEALNWHFDRSEFTTTLLLQAPGSGGDFEYVKDLRSDDDPNYDGVARLLNGQEPTRILPVAPGTLNVFRGKNTAHRVTPVAGPRPRIIAVFSYFDRPGVTFSAEERLGFYGRAA